MEKIRVTRIIRTRGQVTIPRRIRQLASWVSPLSAVAIILERPEEIRIEPARRGEVDWEALWEKIRRVRSLRGRRGQLSAFIATDRRSRR